MELKGLSAATVDREYNGTCRLSSTSVRFNEWYILDTTAVMMKSLFPQ